MILLIGNWFTYTLVATVDIGVASNDLEAITTAPTMDLKDSRWEGYGKDTRTPVEDLTADTGYRPGRRAPRVEPFAKDIVTVKHASGSDKLTALMWWVMLNLTWVGFIGFAIFYLLGGATSVYADLRADVDGTEEDEIFVENEDGTLDETAEGGAAIEAKAADDKPAAPAAPDVPGREAGRRQQGRGRQERRVVTLFAKRKTAA